MIASCLSLLLSADWTPLPPTGASSLVALRSRGDTVVACGTGGCAFSDDGGASWTRPADFALPAYYGISNLSGNRLAIVEDGRLLLSADRGNRWTTWNEGIPSDAHLEAVALGSDLGFAVASKVRRAGGTTIFTDTCEWFLRRTGDLGWRSLGKSVSYSPSGLAVGHGGSLWRTRVQIVAGSHDQVVEHSTDGDSWDTLRTKAVLQRVDDAIFLVRLESRDSFLLSLDSGRTWSVREGRAEARNILDGAIHTSVDTVWRGMRDGKARAIDLSRTGTVQAWVRAGRRLFANSDSGLFLSLDSGTSWTRADATWPLGVSSALRWQDGTLVNIPQSGWSQSIARSLDGGRTWTRLLGGLRSLDRLQVCPEGLMSNGRNGTVLVRPDGAILIPRTALAGDIACDGSHAWTIVAGQYTGQDSLGSWTGAGWVGGSTRRLGDAQQIAAAPGGIFIQVYDEDDRSMRLDFLADGSDSARRTELGARVKWIAGSPRGVWVGAEGGLHRCTGPATCVQVPLEGTDSLWSFPSVTVQERFVLVSAIPRATPNGAFDYRQARLFASADSGTTWTSLEAPFLIRDAAVTTEGIVANLYGAGLWLWPSEPFRVSSGVRRAGREARSLLSARGRTLVAEGVVPGVRLRVTDPAGRLVLDVHPTVRTGRAEAKVPATAHGMLVATLTGAGETRSLRWVLPDR